MSDGLSLLMCSVLVQFVLLHAGGPDCGAIVGTDFSAISSFTGVSSTSGSGWVYSINMCDPVNVYCLPSDSSRVCQYEPNNHYGPFVVATAAATPGNWTLVNATNAVYSAPGNDGRYATITFACAPEDMTTYYITQTGNHYFGTIFTQAACSMKYDNNNNDNNNSGISIGTILIIIFIISIFVYCIVGFALNYFYFMTKRSELSSKFELLPNVAFWKDLPLLVRDGAYFTFRQVRSLCVGKSAATTGETYETM